MPEPHYTDRKKHVRTKIVLDQAAPGPGGAA